jgi:hypothetical protein
VRRTGGGPESPEVSAKKQHLEEAPGGWKFFRRKSKSDSAVAFCGLELFRWEAEKANPTRSRRKASFPALAFPCPTWCVFPGSF